MGFFSRFERRVEDGFDGMGDKFFDAPISPVQIAKKAEKQMRREKMVGAGKEYAPTLYTVLVNPEDDERLFGYYPTLAGETETYLRAKANEEGLAMDGAPLVRFIVDDELKSGKFDIIAEMVSAPIIEQLRDEEMQRYGILQPSNHYVAPQNYAPAPQPANPYPPQAAPAPAPQPAPQNQPHYASSGIDVMTEDPQIYDQGPAGNANVAPQAAPQTMVFPGAAAAPAPLQAAPGEPELVNLNTGQAFPLTKNQITVGRALTNDIVLDDLNVSRAHCEFQRKNARFWGVADLGSTNGTLVNGKHIASVTLNEGDRITVGTTTFLFTNH